MYLSGFVHREQLFELTRRWLCARLEPDDGLLITRTLICDGFVLGETLEAIIRKLLAAFHQGSFELKRIHFKGELRETLCKSVQEQTPRVMELIQDYRKRPEFYYKDVPINGVMALDQDGRLLGLYRLKRPRRIAEKANRYIANWIFQMVQQKARRLAEERARVLRIPLELLLTPEEEMAQEFIRAEKEIAESFRDGRIQMDRSALTINDIGGIKIVADQQTLARLEELLEEGPYWEVVEKEEYKGEYRAKSFVLKHRWDKDGVCKAFMEKEGWKRYLNRGIPEQELAKGIGAWLEDASPELYLEVMFSTFPDMVESELGSCIHEERILAQRDTKVYKGYIPANVEFLVEYLFSLGLSPKTQIDSLPILLWGRYLPETMISKIRALYGVGENGPLY
ncbi:MAG: hypothetical protein WHX93_02035 [bacterium]